MTLDRVPAEDIVQLLAKAPEPATPATRADPVAHCTLCLAKLSPGKLIVDEHYADCPWRLAREWVDGAI